MTKEQEEAIEIIDKMIKSYIEADECGLSNNDFKHEIRAMKTVLNMLQEQQEENKKKDKIIDLMARFMTNKDIDEDICRYQVVEHCKDEEHGVTTNVCINCIKQYFERKAE